MGSPCPSISRNVSSARSSAVDSKASLFRARCVESFVSESKRRERTRETLAAIHAFVWTKRRRRPDGAIDVSVPRLQVFDLDDDAFDRFACRCPRGPCYCGAVAE